MSINNREDANKYYQVINVLVDDYIDKWKIRPSNLRRYLQPGSERFNKFLERNGLKEIKGADRVLKDIIEDRDSMEKDGVITFESFKIFESDEFKVASLKQAMSKGIDKPTKDHEKILADHFDTSLGHINVIDTDKHSFKIDGWDDGKDVIIYSTSEISIIKENIIEFCYNELISKKVEITELISVDLSNLIKKDSFKYNMEEFLNHSNTVKVLTNCLGDYEFDKDFGGYFIWIKKN